MSRALIYKEILRDYEKDRDASKRILEKRKEEVYSKIPRIKEIDKELSMTGVSITKNILSSSDSSDKKLLIDNLKKKNNILLDEKRKLMTDYGFPNDYFEDIYKCRMCSDTGYIKSNKCICFNQRIIEKAYDMSNIKASLKYENFDNFNLNYYSGKVDSKEGTSPLENIKVVWTNCLNFVRDFDIKHKSILFYGNPGLGKTFLCNCIAKDLLDRGKTVLYVTAFQLFKMVENEKFKKDEFESESGFLDLIYDADLLIIDDLGTEFSTIVSNSELFNIINLRLNSERSTIISTNLNPKDLMNQYSERVASRIFGEYDTFHLFGDDIRILKMNQG